VAADVAVDGEAGRRILAADVEVDAGVDGAAGRERAGDADVAGERQRRREGAGLVQRAVQGQVGERVAPVAEVDVDRLGGDVAALRGAAGGGRAAAAGGIGEGDVDGAGRAAPVDADHLTVGSDGAGERRAHYLDGGVVVDVVAAAGGEREQGERSDHRQSEHA